MTRAIKLLILTGTRVNEMIGAEKTVVDNQALPGFSTNGGFYHAARGFARRIVQRGDTYDVVFRGSDFAEHFSAGLSKAVSAGMDQLALDG